MASATTRFGELYFPHEKHKPGTELLQGIRFLLQGIRFFGWVTGNGWRAVLGGGREQIRRTAFKCLPDLKKVILDESDENNRNPKPFVWTATADLILGKLEAFCSRINHSGH